MHTAHVCSTALILKCTYKPIMVETLLKNQENATFIYNAITICVSNKYAPQIPHMLTSLCTHMRPMYHFTCVMNSLESGMWPGALLYTHFTLLAYTLEYICVTLWFGFTLQQQLHIAVHSFTLYSIQFHRVQMFTDDTDDADSYRWSQGWQTSHLWIHMNRNTPKTPINS